MTEAPSIRSLPNRLLILTIAVLALALVAGGSLLSPGNANAKKKQRVVSISPFATEVLAEVGVRPVRIGQVLSDRRGEQRIPKKFRGIARLPLSHPNGPNLESLAKLRPTIVFSSTRWWRGTAAMKGLGIKVVYADPTNLGKAYRDAKLVAGAVGKKSQGVRLAATMRRQVKAASRPSLKTRVMGILGVGRNPQLFLGNSWGGQMIRLAGGTLLTGGASNSGGFAPISDEVVVAQNPEVIVGVPHGSVTDIGTAFQYILDNPAWQTVSAVDNGKVKGSFDNRLLQAGTDVGRTIRVLRRCLASKRVQICQ